MLLAPAAVSGLPHPKWRSSVRVFDSCESGHSELTKVNPGDKFCFKCGSRFAEISHPSARISTPYDERVSSSSSTKSLSKAEERRGYKQLSWFEKERQRSRTPPPRVGVGEGGYLGPRIQFSFRSS